MKTHKNPELRKHQTPVPFKKADNAYKSVATAKKPVKKSPPKLELEGKKWIVVSFHILPTDSGAGKHQVLLVVLGTKDRNGFRMQWLILLVSLKTFFSKFNLKNVYFDALGHTLRASKFCVSTVHIIGRLE